jgi:hypothetical protein
MELNGYPNENPYLNYLVAAAALLHKSKLKDPVD